MTDLGLIGRTLHAASLPSKRLSSPKTTNCNHPQIAALKKSPLNLHRLQEGVVTLLYARQLVGFEREGEGATDFFQTE